MAAASSMTCVKLALTLCFFGLQAFVFAIVAEDKKPLFGTRMFIGKDYVMCQFPRLSVVMGSLSLVSLLLTILAGHVAVLYPYANTTAPLPPRALFRISTSLIVFFVVAELVSASALAMLLRATITQGRHATGLVQFHLPPQLQAHVDDTTVTSSCPSTPKTDGHFGGGAVLALDAALMWFVCQLFALEARATYRHLHMHGDDDDDHGNKKKQDDVVSAAAHA